MDIFSAPGLPHLVNVHEILDPLENADATFDLADSAFTTLYEYDPSLCADFIDPKIESVEFMCVQDHPTKWYLVIARHGTVVSVNYKDRKQDCWFEWNLDDRLRMWGPLLDSDGALEKDEGLKESRIVAQKILLNKSWLPIVLGRRMCVKTPKKEGDVQG